MKLKDFLKEFEGMDPEAEVYLQMSVGCCGETEDLDPPEVWQEDVLDKRMKPSGEQQVRVMFPSFDFLSSCRKYGNALDGAKSIEAAKLKPQ